MDTKQLLLTAVNIINTRGHCKGTYEDSAGRVCVYGALNFAWRNTSGPSSFTPPYVLEASARLADECIDKYNTGLVTFNDCSDTTKQDVINLFKLAANSLSSQGD